MRTYQRVRLGDRKHAIMLGGQKFTGQAGNPLLNNLSKTEIERTISNFMSGDSKFNNAIHNHLLKRLKYATGRLLKSIDWKVKVIVDGKANDFSVSIGVYLENPELIDALLSGAELQDQGKHLVPNTEDLFRYIKAKRQHYSELINDRNSQLTHQYARNSAKGLSYSSRPNSVLQIAEEIREAMLSRWERGLAPTLGSDFSLVGWNKVEMPDDTGRMHTVWKPKYKRYNTPLYSLNSDKGEINQAIQECLNRYFDKMFSPNFGRAISNSMKGSSLFDMMDRIMPEIMQDKSLNSKLQEASQRLLEIVDIVKSKTKTAQENKWKFTELYSKQTDIINMRIDRISKANIVSQNGIDAMTRLLLRDIESVSSSTKKRRLGRGR